MPQIVFAIGVYVVTIDVVGTALVLALTAASVMIQKRMAKKAASQTDNTGARLDSGSDTAPPWRIIYGEVHVPAYRTFIASGENPLDLSGNDTIINEMLYTVWTVAAHRIRQFKAIFLGDYPIYRTMLVKADGTNVNPSGNPIFGTRPETPLMNEMWTCVQGRYAQGIRDATQDENGDPLPVWSVPFAVDFSLGEEAEGVQPFPFLNSSLPNSWPATSQQVFRSKIFMLNMHNRNRFPDGLPNVSMLIRGRLLRDPRDDPDFSLVTRRYSRNPAVAGLDFLLGEVDSFGFGAREAEIDFASFEAGANVCDEILDVTPLTAGYHERVCDQSVEPTLYPRVITEDAPDLTRQLGRHRNTILLEVPKIPVRFSSGDRVQVAAVTGTLPTGLSAATDYYIAVLEPWPAPTDRKRLEHEAYTTYGQPYDYNLDMEAEGLDRTKDTFFLPRVAFHTTYEDAIEELPETRVAITAMGTGAFRVFKTGEPRYTCDMAFDVDRPRRETLEAIASSMAGEFIYTGGKWVCKAGAYETPTVALDTGDACGPLQVKTRASMRDRFTSAEGLYTLHFESKGELVTYPIVRSQGAITADDEEVTAQLDLPATSRVWMARRIAQIELLKQRQQITFTQEFNFKAYQLRAGSTFTYTNSTLGWTAKPFKVLRWERVYNEENNVPRISFRISAQETAAEVYEADESLLLDDDLTPNTELPNAFVVGEPRNLEVTEEQRNPSGQIVNWVARITWLPPIDGFVETYDVQWRSEDEDDYDEQERGISGHRELALELFNLEADKVWYFRVRARNHLGIPSDWIEVSAEILGLTAPPSTPTGFQVVSMGSYAQASWDQAPELDVRLGGACMLRIDEGEFTETPEWAHSVTIGFTDGIDGAATSTPLPLKTGWYCLKFIDVLGNESTGAAFAFCAQTSPTVYTNEIDAAFEPAFDGDKYEVEVDGSDNLELSSTGVLVEPEGVYYPDMGDFSALFDDHAGDFDDGGMFDASYAYISGGGTRRVTSNIDGVVISGLDTDFDSHAGLFDDGGDFDGAQGADADIWMEVSTSQDADPSDPTSTWSDWFRVDSSILSYTGLVPRFQYRSYQGNTQIDAATLGIVIDEPA